MFEFLKNNSIKKKFQQLSIIELDHLLKIAIEDEEYEIAALIKEELHKRTGLYNN